MPILASFVFQRFLLWLLSGMMIGPGGPFWFDLYRKSGRLTGIARDYQSLTHCPGEPGVKPSTGMAAVQTPHMVTDVFDTATNGHAMALQGGPSSLAADGFLDKGAMQ